MNEYGCRTVTVKFLPDITWKLLHILQAKEDKPFWKILVDALHFYVKHHQKLEKERIEFNYPEELPE